MRNNNKRSIDGFVSRTPRSQVGETNSSARGRVIGRADVEYAAERVDVPVQAPNGGVSRSEIDDSLRQIDIPESARPYGRRKKAPAERSKKGTLVKRILIVVGILVVLIGGYVGIKAFIASSKAFQGNFFNFLQQAPLKQDAQGRSNILVFGTSEDDEGGDHPGAMLTDSLMVVSVDQTKKDAYMISIPRDLWVKLGATCEVGNESKINALYMCASNDGKDEQAGAQALKSKIGEILGLDIQYHAHINYTVVADAVNAVGGIDLKIESEDPRGIYDPNFDWKCNYKCRMVDYKNGEVAHLDGEHALALARARNAAGGYGLPGGNFDREKNQQRILKALQAKAVSAGTVTNVGKVTGLIDALGNNLRTNFETKEIRTLMKLAQEVQGSQIHSISLIDEKDPVVTTGDIYGQSIVQPIEGLYEYGQIGSYIRKQVSSDPVAKEAANITVLNASGVAGLAQEKADSLEGQGFTVTHVGNASESDAVATKVYQIGEGNAATRHKLESIFGTTIATGTVDAYVSQDTDFVVVVGKQSAKNQQQ